MCQACGACCSFSQDWPRFSLEDDAAAIRIDPGVALVYAVRGSVWIKKGDLARAITLLRNGAGYANIHTVVSPGGEIRVCAHFVAPRPEDEQRAVG